MYPVPVRPVEPLSCPLLAPSSPRSGNVEAAAGPLPAPAPGSLRSARNARVASRLPCRLYPRLSIQRSCQRCSTKRGQRRREWFARCPRCSSRSRWTGAGSRSPCRRSRPGSSSRSTSPRRSPLIQSATGTESPRFLRCTTALGSRASAARLKVHFVRIDPTLNASRLAQGELHDLAIQERCAGLDGRHSSLPDPPSSAGSPRGMSAGRRPWRA